MNRKVLLVDVDSKIPNLPLMKISTYYKSLDYEVQLMKLGFSYYPHNKNIEIDLDCGYEKCYLSIIFKQNKDRVSVTNGSYMYGGVGYDLKNKLPDKVEKLEPDYSLYPDNDTSYGYITRGCIRSCKFCVVPEKEGNIHQVNQIKDIVRHKKVKFMDNNILAFNRHIDILQELKEKQIRCQFNQGLDIKLLTDENAKLLSELNYMSEYIFAFDSIHDGIIVNSKLHLLKKYIPTDWKIKFYLYCHPDMDIHYDLIWRIEWCKNNKVKPYLMRDSSCWDSKYDRFYKYLEAWCNQPGLFKKLTFKEFMIKRTNTEWRQKESIGIYYDVR